MGSIFKFLAKLIDVFFYWRKRKDDPDRDREKRYKKAEAEVAEKDSIDASVSGRDDLDKLHILQNRKRD